MNSIQAKIKTAVTNTVDSGTHINIASASENIAKRLGLSERWVEYTHMEFRNKMNEFSFKKAPFSERLLFLPHCMRNSNECKAHYTEEGLQCQACGKCLLSNLIKEAKELGYKGAFVCPGGSIIPELVKKYKPKAVLGVCCYKEAILGFDILRANGVAAQAVLLSKSGCINTEVNKEEVFEKLRLKE